MLPHGEDEPPLVAFPLVLPMGWTESPPTFCTTTETVVDLANAYLGRWDPPRHPLEGAASQPPTRFDDRPILYNRVPRSGNAPTARVTHLLELPERRKSTPALKYADVYVDDEILLCPGAPDQLDRYRRIFLPINDLVFRPNDSLEENRRELIPLKKISSGDACLSTCHQVLGWVIDTL
jgi:hypothetical protein